VATCKLCGKKKLLLKMNDVGVCQPCIDDRYPYFERCCKIINENVKILNISNDTHILLTCCDTLLDNLKPLQEIESAGIPGWLDKPVVEAIAEVESTRNDLIQEKAQDHIGDVKREVGRLASGYAKIDTLTRGIMKLEDMERDYGTHEIIEKNKRILKALAHNVQAKEFLNAARQAEAVENFKEALDQYKEALDFSKHEHVKDSAQAKTIAQLEQKIAFLEQR